MKWSNTWNKYPDCKEPLGGNIYIGTGLPRGPVRGLGRGNRSGTEDEANKNVKKISDPRRSNDLSKGNTETCYMASAEEHWHLINPVKVFFRANIAGERINVCAVIFHYRKLIGSIQNWKMKKWSQKHYSLENPELGSSPSPSHLGEPARRVQPLKEAYPDPGSITFWLCGIGPLTDSLYQWVNLQQTSVLFQTLWWRLNKTGGMPKAFNINLVTIKFQPTALEMLFTTQPLKLFSIANHEK